MGRTKTEKFTKEQNSLAAMAKALAHPARIAILQVLARKNACICGDIVDELPLSQATVSQHLKELKNAGLIKGEVEGVRVCYYLNRDELNQASKQLDDLFKDALNPGCC